MDPYIHSRSHLLKNKANLHTPEALAAHEARMVFKRLIFLYSRPVTGTFDLAHLLAIHHALFQDVYPWAGRVRSCDLSLGLVSFCPAQWLESSLTALFGELARENWLWERERGKIRAWRGLLPGRTERDPSLPRRKRSDATGVHPGAGAVGRP